MTADVCLGDSRKMFIIGKKSSLLLHDSFLPAGAALICSQGETAELPSLQKLSLTDTQHCRATSHRRAAAGLSLPPAVSASLKGLKDIVRLSNPGGGEVAQNTQGLFGVQSQGQRKGRKTMADEIMGTDVIQASSRVKMNYSVTNKPMSFPCTTRESGADGESGANGTSLHHPCMLPLSGLAPQQCLGLLSLGIAQQWPRDTGPFSDKLRLGADNASPDHLIPVACHL